MILWRIFLHLKAKYHKELGYVYLSILTIIAILAVIYFFSYIISLANSIYAR